MRRSFFQYTALLLAVIVFTERPVQAQLVPGTGVKLTKVGDDFEDETWSFKFNLPKSSKNINEYAGGTGGRSSNGRWYEGVKRGQPDVVKRVPTPKNGPEGSTGALLLRSLQTGVPGRPSRKLQQDDFIADVNYRLGGSMSVAQSPSVVVRVFMPPIAEWENRSGPSFAFRIALDTTTQKTKGSGFFSKTTTEKETYWPGFFVEFESETDRNRTQDGAYLRVRANTRGADYRGPAIRQTGWWTLGLSCTPDGRVHYYAKPGLEDLTADDYITSNYPYGFRAERFKTFFFNVCNDDDGTTWSTPWIVDNCEVFHVPRTARTGRTSR
jgi:hypothetical protein